MTETGREEIVWRPTREYAERTRIARFMRSLGIDLDAQLDYEEDLQREAGATADYTEGVRAFLEKRKPVFQGK